jgi:hypothetical protein
MAVSIVQRKAVNNGSEADQVLDLSFDSLPSAGRAVVVACFGYLSSIDFGTGSVTDNQGNTYTRRTSATIGTAAQLAIYDCLSIGSPSGTFTVSIDGGSAGTLKIIAVILEVAGLSTFEGQNTATGSSTAPSVTRTVAAASAFQVSAAMAAANQESIVVGVLSPTWTEEAEQLSYSSYMAGEIDSRVADIGTGDFTAAWTLATSASWAAGVAVYTAAAASTAATVRSGQRVINLAGSVRTCAPIGSRVL